jgi:predicted DNA-binding protein
MSRQSPPSTYQREPRERQISEVEQQELEEIIARGVRHGDYQALSDELDIYVQELLSAEPKPYSG